MTEVIPGRGRHMSKILKVGLCEVYLRKYQITDLAHEVHEKSIFAGRKVGWNQDMEGLEPQIKG